jgi:hypothetical protein
VPRSRIRQWTGPRGRHAHAPSWHVNVAASEQTGPSTSTEPGWMVAHELTLVLLGGFSSPAANDPSMLLSFERPALAGSSVDAHFNAPPKQRAAGRRYTPLHGP